MTALLKSKALIAGVLLIVLTNLVVIMGALGNRAGEPEAQLELTERELNYWPAYSRENSGISLHLNVRHHRGNEDHWLDQEKLESLGFRFPSVDTELERWRLSQKVLPKAVYVVLEFDGVAYQAAIDEAKERLAESEVLFASNPDSEALQSRLESNLERVEALIESSTRLYSVDAGLDPVALRERYPDRSQFIIATGEVRPYYRSNDRGRWKVSGSIERIHVTNIHVPLEHRGVLDGLPRRERRMSRQHPPRYKVVLAYGSRYEPWVRSIEAVVEEKPFVPKVLPMRSE